MDGTVDNVLELKSVEASGGVAVDATLTIPGAAADAKVTGDFKNSLNIVNPDSYSGGDTNKIQRAINDLVSAGTGGIIYVGRKYTLNSSVVCNLSTDSSNPHTDKVYIIFLGVGKDAGFEFGASSVSFQGNDSGSPYGGLRFVNINFYQHEAGIGYGSAFTQMSGNIRAVFDNCRFNGFKNVFDGSSAGNASLKIIQNITCIKCYFANCSDYVVNAYGLGSDLTAPYVYAVNFFSCIIEKCKGLIKGSTVSGHSVWTSVNIENCTVENCTGIPIVFGEGVRGVSVAKNYFEKNDYSDTHANIDLRGLYGGDTENKASVYGLDISNNVFIKGIDSGSYTAHSVGILLPTQEPWTESDSVDLVHGVIARNVFEDVAFVIDGSPDNPLRFKIEDNSYDAAVDKTVFHSYVDATLSVSGIPADAAAVGELKSALLLDNSKAVFIASNSDLNNYRTPGNYKISSYAVASTVSHIPERVAGRLVVMSLTAAARVLQIYIPVTATAKIWARTFNDSWNEWSRVLTVSDLDSVPTQDSNNPVTSGGVYTALQDKQDTLIIDSTPTQGHMNPVSSDGVYTALAAKQNLLTAGTGITIDSNNVISASGGGIGWRQLTTQTTGADIILTPGTNLDSVDSVDAYYCAALGIVRLMVRCTTGSVVTYGSNSNFNLYFGTASKYKPKLEMYTSGGENYGVAHASIIATPGTGSYVCGVHYDDYFGITIHGESDSASPNADFFFHGFYYTEDIPSS